MNESLIRIAAFTAGSVAPSARFRVRQYIGDLRASGVLMNEYFPRKGSAYPPRGTLDRIRWLPSLLSQRFSDLGSSMASDITLLQRQMVSTINTLERFTKRPRLLDVDDAIWMSARFGSVDSLAKRCDGVICGNDRIADHFSRLNRCIYIIPTAIDVRIFIPKNSDDKSVRRKIGWVGTSGNLKYLYAIEKVIENVLKLYDDVDLLVVSDKAPEFKSLAPSRVYYRTWSEENEVSDIQSMTLGLMPLADSPWAQGKCSFKMLQYMSCSVPAVVSPVGMNVQVAEKGGALLAATLSEWQEAIVSILVDDSLRGKLAKEARNAVCRFYATEKVATQLAEIFRFYV
ncbi:group 1 glycosyl transferase [Rhodanobacter sp. 115]|nr:group 1 glycosyl transferase [Rhodanobacter sp. 115]